MTRLTTLGLSGRKGTQFNQLDVKKAIFEVDLAVVASGAAQTTGILLPPSQILSAFVYVQSPEVTGTTKTVSVGFAGGAGTEVINAADVSATGITGSLANPANAPLGTEITYTLGSADFAELKARVVIEYNSVTNL